MLAIALEELTKTYPGGKQAVRQVSLSLEEGEVFGFLGPNGAGKTTTVKLLTGMLRPSAGSCRVFGLDPAAEPEKVHALSGVVTEHAQMYDNLSGMQNLCFYASLFGIPEAEGKRRAAALLRQLDLEEAGERKLGAYSTGMRQKLSLARAMLPGPKVLFLDEPTSGLDPESTQAVNRMIQETAQEMGTTVFLCTHQLRYAQEICTRYGLLEEGRLLAFGTLDGLRTSVLPGATLHICAEGMPDGLMARQTGKRTYEMSVNTEEEVPAVVCRIVEAGGAVYSVALKPPSLEDIYFALTGKKEENGHEPCDAVAHEKRF